MLWKKELPSTGAACDTAGVAKAKMAAPNNSKMILVFRINFPFPLNLVDDHPQALSKRFR